MCVWLLVWIALLLEGKSGLFIEFLEEVMSFVGTITLKSMWNVGFSCYLHDLAQNVQNVNVVGASYPNPYNNVMDL